jgi:hypothetical protein
MSWAKWIVAYLFDCVHLKTTWPQRGRNGLDYVCCLDCGREFPYSTRLMSIVSKRGTTERSESVQLGGARESQTRTHCAV